MITLKYRDEDGRFTDAQGNAVEGTYNDLYLDESNNLAIYDSVDNAVSNIEAVLAVVKNVVQTHKFELQLDMQRGIPYMSTIFESATLVALWQSKMVEAIEGVENVNFVELFNATYDRKTKILHYECRISTTFGTGALSNNYAV